MLSVLPLAKNPTSNDSVQVSTAFIDKFLASSTCVNPLYVVVYLFVLRHTENHPQIKIPFIASELEIFECNVLAALKHWASLGVLSFQVKDGIATILFNNEASTQESSQPEPVLIKTQENSPQLELNVLSLANERGAENSLSMLTAPCPAYTPEELEIYSERTEIKALFDNAQKHLGRLLTYNDMHKLFSFYDWLRLPTPVIDKLLAHCRESGHTNMAYIERVATDWAERNIDTCDKADDYIQLFNKDFREILKAFGIFGRNPGASEQEFMRVWRQELNMPLDMVVWACDQTVLATGGVNFKYADKIIKRWHEDSILTLEDAKAQSELHKSNAAAELPAKKSRRSGTKKEPAARPKGSNKYLNFKQRDYNFDEIKAMERERLKQDYLERNRLKQEHLTAGDNANE